VKTPYGSQPLTAEAMKRGRIPLEQALKATPSVKATLHAIETPTSPSVSYLRYRFARRAAPMWVIKIQSRQSSFK
jgi:hypothetical protein